MKSEGETASRTFLVMGAGGNVGFEVAAALLSRGCNVVAPVRSLGRQVPVGATAVLADFRKPETLLPLLAGVEGLFVLAGHRATRQLLSEASSAGVRHVVLLSTAATEDENNTDALTAFHRRAEDDVAASGLTWTFLRPQAFSSNALSWSEQVQNSDMVELHFSDLPLACVDPRDLGQVAAKALTEPGHHAEAYRLSGPTPLLPAEQLAIVAEVVGRPLIPVTLDDDRARDRMLGDRPPAIVDAFFQLYRSGGLDESVVTRTVPDLLGRPAGTFREWVVRHRDRFGTRTLPAETSDLPGEGL